jgi:hypothetical protein
MRLAIADPPYLGRGRWYGAHGGRRTVFRSNGTMNRPADVHPDAAIWDDPTTHVQLIKRLRDEFDGWAVAAARDSLPVYLAADPTVHIAVWHNPASWPPGGRIHASWEPVLLSVPSTRRAAVGTVRTRDVLRTVPPRELGFIGAKPPQWTRWVLDMLGYEPEVDEVVDLFAGSGAVAHEVAQGVLPFDTEDTT